MNRLSDKLAIHVALNLWGGNAMAIVYGLTGFGFWSAVLHWITGFVCMYASVMCLENVDIE